MPSNILDKQSELEPCFAILPTSSIVEACEVLCRALFEYTCVPERPSDVLPDPQVYSKRAQPSCLTSFRKCKFSDIAKQGSSSVSSELPLFLDRAGQEHPRAGSRHRFAPSRRGRGATAAEFRSRPRGREPLASSGRLGSLLHVVVQISQIRR